MLSCGVHVMALAHIAPDAAADGVPIPGKYEFQHLTNNPSMGVFMSGKGGWKNDKTTRKRLD